jgi:hypothetical protein
LFLYCHDRAVPVEIDENYSLQKEKEFDFFMVLTSRIIHSNILCDVRVKYNEKKR